MRVEERHGAEQHTFAWITDWPLRPDTARAVAAQGGRVRSQIENQGFSLQKNSGLNLEHAYSTAPDVLKAFYHLLQIARLFLQMFELGSLPQRLAQQYGRSPRSLFGSLKNLNQGFLEQCFRYFLWGDAAFATAPCRIRLLDSSGAVSCQVPPGFARRTSATPLVATPPGGAPSSAHASNPRSQHPACAKRLESGRLFLKAGCGVARLTRRRAFAYAAAVFRLRTRPGRKGAGRPGFASDSGHGFRR